MATIPLERSWTLATSSSSASPLESAPNSRSFRFFSRDRFSTSAYVSALDSVVILDGTPVVGSDRAEKLIGAIKKAAQKEGGIALEREAFNMPLGPDEKSKGYIFVTLQNAHEALAFRRALNDYPFDKKHTFKVVPFTEVERYTQLDEQYVAPPAEEWVPRVSPLPFAFHSQLIPFCRSTSETGSPIPPDETSCSSTAQTTLPLPGTPKPVHQSPLSNDMYAFSTRALVQLADVSR